MTATVNDSHSREIAPKMKPMPQEVNAAAYCYFPIVLTCLLRIYHGHSFAYIRIVNATILRCTHCKRMDMVSFFNVNIAWLTGSAVFFKVEIIEWIPVLAGGKRIEVSVIVYMLPKMEL